MSQEDEIFFKKLLSIFYNEASEHIQKMASTLIELEKTTQESEQKKQIETIYRAAHSLKGAAASVELKEIGFLCQSLESLLAQFLKQPSLRSMALFNLLHKTLDRILEIKEASKSGAKELQKEDDFQLVQQLETFTQTEVLPEKTDVIQKKPEILPEKIVVAVEKKMVPLPPPNAPLSPLVKIPTERLDALLRQAEEMLSIQWSETRKVEELQLLYSGILSWEKEWSKSYPYFRKIQKSEEPIQMDPLLAKDFQKLLHFLEWNQSHVRSLGSQLKTLVTTSVQSLLTTKRMIGILLETTKDVLMLPVSEILEGIPKVVRDLSLKQGKKIRFVFQNSDIEIDKRILDELRNPLLHLVRNSIDHGLETPSERVQHQKPEEGQISIVFIPQESQKVKITFSDDGAGISLEKVKTAVIKAGLFTEQELEKWSVPEIHKLIFLSGISTSTQVTSVSGRGLGLSIVQETIERLGGSISVESSPRKGITFHLLLPLTLSTFRGVLVKTSNQIFVAPTTYVIRVLKYALSDIKTVENQKMIEFHDQAIPLVWLNEVLELPPIPKSKQNFFFVMILKTASTSIAFIVDEILNEQEVLTKSLGKQLRRVRNISGGTILGSGEIAFLLNVSDLIQSCIKKNTHRASFLTEPETQESKTILVVEDSITARMLIKNILELAGYQVDIAVDGLDAYQKIETKSFDLIVTDIEMPRINGLNLCAKIRADSRVSHLPVILLSALESEEDRKRGLEVGADAYLVKSSFEQSNLLETVRRLL